MELFGAIYGSGSSSILFHQKKKLAGCHSDRSYMGKGRGSHPDCTIWMADVLFILLFPWVYTFDLFGFVFHKTETRKAGHCGA